ncbi:MAG: response regulator [Lachnospiraceae bacterium]|nr:response regulator [Lachnospiraceae bacterium]
MKKILLIGKMNDILRDLNRFLSGKFAVQVASDQADALTGLIKVTEPDLIIVSLVGMYDGHEAIFTRLKESSSIPVLTVGIQEERDRFLRFYEDGQIENILRPVEHSVVYRTVCEKLGIESGDSESSGEENSGKRSSGQRKRVLVVDDNGPTLRTIKGMLDEEFEVQLAPSGMKAMTGIGKLRPDLILLDYEMPVCDGRQTLEMIRADEDLAFIPVIFLTSVNDREHIEKVLSLHPQGYLLKPPVKEKLIEAIRRTLEKER